MTASSRTVYFVVATIGGQDERRGPAYSTRAAAQGWVSFVRKALRGVPSRVRVLACRLRWVDGKLDADSIARLDKFNMDPPEETA